MSTAEAEYHALTEVLQGTTHTQTLAMSFNTDPAHAELEKDYKPALDMIESLGATKRSKFIDLRYHYLTTTIKQKNVELKNTPYELLHADLLTKVLDCRRFERLLPQLGVDVILNIAAELMG